MQEVTIKHFFYFLFVLQSGFKDVALKAIIQVVRLLEGHGHGFLARIAQTWTYEKVSKQSQMESDFSFEWCHMKLLGN